MGQDCLASPSNTSKPFHSVADLLPFLWSRHFLIRSTNRLVKIDDRARHHPRFFGGKKSDCPSDLIRFQHAPERQFLLGLLFPAIRGSMVETHDAVLTWGVGPANGQAIDTDTV